jgi:hypothetical protein
VDLGNSFEGPTHPEAIGKISHVGPNDGYHVIRLDCQTGPDHTLYDGHTGHLVEVLRNFRFHPGAVTSREHGNSYAARDGVR